MSKRHCTDGAISNPTESVPNDDNTNTTECLKALKSKKMRIDLQKTDKVQWNCMEEVVNIEEEVIFFPPEKTQVFDISVLTTWRKVARKEDIKTQENMKFMSINIYQQLLEARLSVSEWRKSFLLSARVRSNPFETLRHAFFMNRAALKMANLDAILGFELTTPKIAKDIKIVRDDELFYFADVCAGPGGFSEYVLWRNKWEAKGFGFTLKQCDCDFNLEDFIAGTPESFEIHYGANKDGNVLDPVNVSSFIRYVLENTEGQGVHLMMADGGVEVDDKSDQEDLCRGLYLAQCLVAIGIVREGGNFVCKLFDMVTDFSVGLIYLMYCSFDKVAIHKPNSSRPANPERYIICKGRKRRADTEGIYEYLSKCHDMLWNYEQNRGKGIATLDISELVPISILTKNNSSFFKYIKEKNDSLGTSQILALQKIEAYCEDPTLKEIRQKDSRQACLVYWNIPDITRRDVTHGETSTNTVDVFQNYKNALFGTVPSTLTKEVLQEAFKSPFDWRFVVLGTGPTQCSRGLFHGTGGTAVLRFQSNYWQPIHLNLSLAKDTVVYAELVKEVSVDLKDAVIAFHIIDGFILGGKDIRNLHYIQRYECCARFAKAMNKSQTPAAVPVRVKPLTRMEHISAIFENIVTSVLEEGVKVNQKFDTQRLFPLETSSGTAKYIHPVGLLFLKITKDPWLMEFSQTAKRKYWLNLNTKASAFDCPVDSVADYAYTMENSVIWNWDASTQVDVINTLISNPAVENSNEIHVKQIVDHVNRFLAHVILPSPPVSMPTPIFSPETSEASGNSESESD